MSEPALRAARVADLPAVRELLARCALPTAGVDASLVGGLCVAGRGGSIPGCAAMEPHGGYGLLRSVAVDPSLRGAGLGRRLVHDRLAWAEGRGIREVFLLTTTAADFFRALGFRPVARDTAPSPIRAADEFVRLCPQSAVVMAYTLTSVARHAS